MRATSAVIADALTPSASLVFGQRARVLLQKEQDAQLGRADAGCLPKGQISALEEPVLRQRKLVDEAMRRR